MKKEMIPFMEFQEKSMIPLMEFDGKIYDTLYEVSIKSLCYPL